ncbi:DUF6542 domain-containing protein [Streptacidiphilus albus]|uniref:DUF6542 domain-containing protein n=1 Tax=Streptacidiphilus albus TaxID=105425 RepID=UPI00128C811C|nr:DUF6542 domain-containing protein [Streptacidiphilus albus]
MPAPLGPGLLVGMPLLGAVLSGGGLGLLYTVSAVVGAVAAAWLSGQSGLWWVATGAPAVVLLVALVARAATDSGAGTGAALATHALAWTAHAFPVMVIVTVAVLLVVLVRVVRERGRGRG